MEYILFSTMVRKLTVFFVLGFFANIGFSQCSDAGICTLSGMRHLEKHEQGLLGLNYNFGKSPKADSLTFNSIRFISEYEFIENNRVKLLIPFNFQKGPLGRVAGLGDFILSFEHIITDLNDRTFVVEAGMKFATAKQNVDSLPQRYQNGLGTNDLLLNATYSVKGVHIGLGLQHPFGRSANFEGLKRGTDLSLRMGYGKTYDAFGFDASIIAVKSFGLQSIADRQGAVFIPYIDVPNSDQFQVNLAIDGKYSLSETVSVTVVAAIPFLKREINVDGLSRSFTLSAGIYVTY